MADATVELAERYIAAEATNVDGSYSKAAFIMRGLLARLSAVEQEREQLQAELVLFTAERNALRNMLDRAEARVEALTLAAERFRAAIDAPSHDGWLTELNAAEAALDAALCAPPVPETQP